MKFEQLDLFETANVYEDDNVKVEATAHKDGYIIHVVNKVINDGAKNLTPTMYDGDADILETAMKEYEQDPVLMFLNVDQIIHSYHRFENSKKDGLLPEQVSQLIVMAFLVTIFIIVGISYATANNIL